MVGTADAIVAVRNPLMTAVFVLPGTMWSGLHATELVESQVPFAGSQNSNWASATEDQAALAWAKANPNDPRAKKILDLLKTAK